MKHEWAHMKDPYSGYAIYIDEFNGESSMDDNMNHLIGETDAQTWAKEFVKIVKEHPSIPYDEGTMIGWFANAIMSGYDEGQRKQKEIGIHSIVREIAYQSAGVGSGAVMKEAPDVVMPSQEIADGVDKVLKEFGIGE